MGNIGWTEVDELERMGFQHETKEFLARLCFKDNGFPIKAVVQEDFIRWQSLDVRVAKNETVVHVADVTNEKVMAIETWI